MTRKLLAVLREKGGHPIFFKDAVMEKEKGWKKNPTFKSVKGHANHIHVCFPDTRANREACESFRYRRSACGPLFY